MQIFKNNKKPENAELSKFLKQSFENKTLNSTGTSIAAVPYNSGYLLISDTRSTNTATYEYFATDKLMHYDKNFALGAAGAAVGLDMVVCPVIDYFLRYLYYYEYDVEELENPHVFLALFNKAVQRYNTQEATQLYMHLLNMGKYIIVFRNKNFVFALSGNFFGDDCLESLHSYRVTQELARKNNYSGDVVAIGSGSRYLIGGFLKLNKEKPLRTLSKEELIDHAKEIYKNTTARDGASDIKEYMQIIDVPEDLRESIFKERLIIN